MLLTVQFVTNTKPAQAATLEPLTTNSYYLDNRLLPMNGGNLSLTFNQLGQMDATHENQSLHSACSDGQFPVYVIIAFGQPWDGNNVLSYDTLNPYSWYTLEQLSNQYAQGWYTNSYNCFRLHLVMGVNNMICNGFTSTNNTNPCVSQHGLSMAQAVENTNVDLKNEGSSWQIDVSGGIDAETASPWGSFSTSVNFVIAYNNTMSGYAAKFQLYDYGDAAPSCYLDWGCDPTQHIYGIAWQIGYDYPFPEAYNTEVNSEWAKISQWSSVNTNNPIRYSVALMDGSLKYCSSIQACWQDFENKNAGYMATNQFAGSVQLPRQ